MSTTYSIIGLGKLGASMAAAIAQRGFHVIGLDLNQRTVDAINAGHAPVHEMGLEETIAGNMTRLRATMSYQEAILNSEVSFVVVPTPSTNDGAFSLQYAARAFHEIGNALQIKQTYHNVVLTSTVLPGATRYGLLPILEQTSGKACGQDFGLCYSPEFIALGSVIHDFLHPDFTLIGEFDERCGAQLEACYTAIMENAPPCHRMSIENAELTKIAINSFVTTKITFANMLAELCEHIPGGNVDVVTKSLGADRRIGARYLTGAIGYGGPCFPRDNQALGFIARILGMQAEIAETTDRVNRSLPGKIISRLQPLIQPGITVAILGLAYKPYSHVVEESQGISIAKAISQTGLKVVAYDPLANEMARIELQDQVSILDSLSECLSNADIIVITTADPIFRQLTGNIFDNLLSPVTVIDCWRILDQSIIKHPNIRYIPIGCSLDDEMNANRLISLWGTLKKC